MIFNFNFLLYHQDDVDLSDNSKETKQFLLFFNHQETNNH